MRFCVSFLIIIFAVSAQASVSDRVIAGSIVNTCFEQGNIKESARNFDIGIGGQGWFPLLGPKHTIVFTRYGSFGMDPNGILVHLPSGLPLVTVKPGGAAKKMNLAEKASRRFAGDLHGRKSRLTAMFFTEEGVLEGLYSDGQSAHLAQISLAAFENERELRVIDAKTHLFAAQKGVGEIAYGAAAEAPFGKVFAKALEEVPAGRYSKNCE